MGTHDGPFGQKIRGERLQDLGQEPERGSGARSVGQVRAEVPGQGLSVVLPDRLVEPGFRQDDVAGGPDRGAERQAVRGDSLRWVKPSMTRLAACPGSGAASQLSTHANSQASGPLVPSARRYFR
jgi:hypothetical protein